MYTKSTNSSSSSYKKNTINACRKGRKERNAGNPTKKSSVDMLTIII